MSKFTSSKTMALLCVFCTAVAIGAAAQTLTTIHNFNGNDGAIPKLMSLVQGTDGNLYGTTFQGGTNNNCSGGCGTIFKITPLGTLTTLHSFNSTDGAYPYAGLVQGTDGNFYGTTEVGGANGYGTAFKISPLPPYTLTTLHSFCPQTGCADGDYPYAGLVQGTDGNFYGTTFRGGTSNYGTVFKISPLPPYPLTTLHSFDGTDSEYPYAGFVQGTDGNFYGTTFGGFDYGTVFKISPLPPYPLTTLHSFCSQTDCVDGAYPVAALTQGTDGNFYGTTFKGGDSSSCSSPGCGAIFKISPLPPYPLTTLHKFDATESAEPTAGLVQGTDGNFYGTTWGVWGYGTVFKISPLPPYPLTTLHSFCSQTDCPDGYGPSGGLIQATDGNFYGTTEFGGYGDGTVFRLSMGLVPFVRTMPTSGKVGTPVMILGTNLTAASRVTFNGTPATFSIASTTEITTTVPCGATTGKVYVTTPNGTLSSNVNFQIIKANTSTRVTSSLNPSTFGAQVTFTATVSSTAGPPCGTVTFKDGAATLGTGALSSGKATLKTSALAVGSHSITAVYPGNADFNGSTSAVLTQTVHKANTSTKLVSSLNPSTFGTAVTFTATVSSTGGTPTGIVTFKDGALVRSTVTLISGKATYTTSSLARGTHPITAMYAGNSDFNGSTSGVLSQVVR